jgi:hypothetical protein
MSVTEKKLTGLKKTKDYGDYLERLNKKFYDLHGNGKIKGKLGNKKTVSKIPGYSYWFKK